MLKNITVLLIDDDNWMLKVLQKTIDKLNVSKVYTAISGYEGINLAIEMSPDVIFLDLMMPELSGTTTLKILKSISLTRNIPVIIITANSDFESLGTVLALGATEFVAKPFTYATIQKKLLSVIENHKPISHTDISATTDIDIDDLDFFNAFSASIENGLKEEVQIIPPIKRNYEEISIKYSQNSEDEIKKILDS